MIQLFSNQSQIGKVASLYVLFVVFTGAAVIAGYDLLTGVAVPPSLSYILGSGVTFALATLQFHLTTSNVSQLAQTITSIQKAVPSVTQDVIASAKTAPKAEEPASHE